MTREELQDFVNELYDKSYKYYALTNNYVDRPTAINTVGHFKPAKNPGNAEIIKSDLVNYVYKYPGVYVLYYRRTPLKNELYETDQIDTRPTDQQTPLTEIPQNTPNTMDNNTQKLVLEIGDLKAENARLSERNEQLRREIARLEEEAEALAAEAEENATSQMADQTVSMVGQVAQILPAVLDKWFSLQEQKNAIMAEQLRRSAQPTPPPVHHAAPKHRPDAQQDMQNEEAGY